MFLAYMDDSGTGDKDKPFQLVTVVMIPDDAFRGAEAASALSLGMLIPEEKTEAFWQKFTEFKTSELFKGYGPFEGIEQDVRFKIIECLLEIVKTFEFPIVYGAVNKAEFEKKCFPYGSANLVDVCFRLCIRGVDEIVSRNYQVALLIVDEADGKTKSNLRDSFYEYRERVRPTSAGKKEQRLPYLHDDVYFGDSRYSVGIQLADLCGYFISKHLEGNTAGEGFYKIIERQIGYSEVVP
jgi:hypothetical protein